MKEKKLWLDCYPVDVTGFVLTVAGLPEPATRQNGEAETHPNGEPAMWLSLSIAAADSPPVSRAVKVPASQVTALEPGMVVVLGGLTVTPYPAKGWARGALAALTVTPASKKAVPPRRPGGS